MKKITAKKTILGLITVLSAAILFIGRNDFHIFPISDHIDTDHPEDAKFYENGMVIIDNNRERILLTDQTDHVSAVISASDRKNESFVDAVVYDGCLYVISLEYDDADVMLQKERVLEYSLSGKLLNELYAREFPETVSVKLPDFQTLFVRNDMLLLAQRDEDRIKIIDPKTGTLIFSDSIGQKVFRSKYYPKQDLLYVSGDLDETFRIDPDGKEPPAFIGSIVESDVNVYGANFAEDFADHDFDLGYYGYYSIFEFGDRIVQSESSVEDGLFFYDPGTRLITQHPTFRLSSGTLFRMISFYAAAAWLAGCLILLLIRILSREGVFFSTVKKLPILLVIGGIVLFMSRSYMDELRSESRQQLTEVKNVIKDVIVTAYPDLIKDIAATDFKAFLEVPENRERIGKLSEMIARITNDFKTDDMFYFANISAADQNGVFRNLTSTGNFILVGQDVGESVADEPDLSGGSGPHDYDMDSQFVSCIPLDGDSGKSYVRIESYYDKKALQIMLSRRICQLLLTLASSIMVLYISSDVLVDIPGKIRKFRDDKAKGDPDAVFNLTPLIHFLKKFSVGVLVTYNVYIVTEISPEASSEEIAARTALIVLIYFGGTCLGQILYSYISHVLERMKCLIVFGTLSILGVILGGIGILLKNFSFIVISSAMIALFYQAGTARIIDGIPSMIRDGQKKTGFTQKIVPYDLAGGVSSTFLVGNLSRHYGFISVYVMILIIIPVLLWILYMMVRSGSESVQRIDTKRIPGVLKRFDNQMFFILFLFIWELVKRYNNYLFPLQSSLLGIDTAMFANFVVFASTLRYLLDGKYEQIQKHVSAFTEGILLLLCSSAVIFSAAFFPNNIYWLLGVYLLCEVMNGYLFGIYWAVIARISEKENAPAHLITGIAVFDKNLLGQAAIKLCQAFTAAGIAFAFRMTGGISLALSLGTLGIRQFILKKENRL